MFCFGIFALRYLHGKEIIDETRTVFVKKNEKGFQLIRNGKPFYIKGGSGDAYFKELADMGGNTIRLYDTINLQNNLDDAEKYGLAVIVDIPIPAYNYKIYTNNEENSVLKHNTKVLVKKYRNHSALLMWNLGNEIHYPNLLRRDFYKEILGKKRFILTFNELLDIIHSEDKNHPVSTSVDYIGVRQYATLKIFSSGIDLLAFNNFGGIKNIFENINTTSKYLGEYPYYISEFAADGWWRKESKFTTWGSPIEQTSPKKAEQIKARYDFLNDGNNNCLGSLIFFWGNKYECTHTWFSLFKDEYKSEILLEIEQLWGKSYNQYKLIGLEYMLVEGKGAFDNLIFAPEELKNTELKLDTIGNDSIRINWEIYPDVWQQGWNKEKYNNKSLKPPSPIDCFISFKNNTATFVTPRKEGPYRIFAYVYNKNGYFTTTNTPFYVLKPK